MNINTNYSVRNNAHQKVGFGLTTKQFNKLVAAYPEKLMFYTSEKDESTGYFLGLLLARLPRSADKWTHLQQSVRENLCGFAQTASDARRIVAGMITDFQPLVNPNGKVILTAEQIQSALAKKKN